MLITTNSQLHEFADRASRSDVLAIDTEFMREKVYRPRLCLIQLGTESEQVAVDPFAVTDAAPLVRLFQNPFVTKVLHACSQDMEVLLDYVGVLPRPLFDTQVAASYLGDRSQIGYGALVEEMCGVALPKTESLTDWSRRPLDDAQITYALDDVRYLPRIWRSMRDDLAARGRTAWLEPEFERLSDPATYRHDPLEAYRRLKRSGSLTRRQLAVARELAAWRERRAAQIDRPRRWVLSDELLVEVVRAAPAAPEALRRIRGAADLSEPDQRGVLEAVARGRACPADELPAVERAARPSADEECVCDLMYALARTVAAEQGLSVTVLASRNDLAAHLAHPASSPLSTGWRHEVLGRHLDDLLAGKVGLTVKDGRLELL